VGLYRREGADGRPRWTARVTIDGRTWQRTFRTREEALAWREAQRTARRAGSFVDPGAGATTVAAWAERWLARHRRPSSLARERAILARWVLPALGHKPLAAVTPADCQELVAAWVDAGLAPRTVHRHHDTLAALFNAAVAADRIARSPVRGVRLPRVDPVERRILAAEELEALVAAHPPEWRAMPLAAALAGLRWGEVAGLQVGDCDLLARRLRVRRQVTRGERGEPVVLTPKSSAGVRDVAVPAALAEELAAHMARRGLRSDDPGAWLFADSAGGPPSYQNWRARVWVPACRAAGLAGLHFHDLRALHASVLARSGVDPRTAATRLGHSDVRLTLDVYARALDEADRAAAEAAGEWLTAGRDRKARGSSTG
jgi:integrase